MLERRASAARIRRTRCGSYGSDGTQQSALLLFTRLQLRAIEREGSRDADIVSSFGRLYMICVSVWPLRQDVVHTPAPFSSTSPFLLPVTAIIACARLCSPELTASGRKPGRPLPLGSSRAASTPTECFARDASASLSERATLYEGLDGSPRGGAALPGGSIGVRRMAARSSHMTLLRRAFYNCSLTKLDYAESHRLATKYRLVLPHRTVVMHLTSSLARSLRLRSSISRSGRRLC